MKTLLNLILFIALLSCTTQSKNEKIVPPQSIDSTKIKKKTTKIVSLNELKLPKDALNSYSFVKNDIQHIQASLAKKSYSKDTVSQIFKRLLLNRIIPYWENTTWSFEGHTAKPMQGEIACGYFVSTTLQDVGLILNRYTLAQQSPINEAKSLAVETAVIEVNEGSKEKDIAKIDKVLKNGIHFIGFEQSHVGYILKEKGKLYLIHSNYAKGKVGIEQIEDSEVFASYSKYYIVELSTNKALLDSWVTNKAISIHL